MKVESRWLVAQSMEHFRTSHSRPTLVGMQSPSASDGPGERTLPDLPTVRESASCQEAAVDVRPRSGLVVRRALEASAEAIEASAAAAIELIRMMLP